MADQHTLKSFDEELDKLRSRVIKMGSIAQQQIEFCVNALINNNHELARLIIANDDKIDNFDIKIDKQCLRIFALHQPVAMDLRLVMSALKINDTIELIGDLACNIAKSILELNSVPVNFEKTKLTAMGKKVEEMIIKVLDSFIYYDINLAKEAIIIKDGIKQLFNENFKINIEIMKSNNNLIEYYSYLNDINRNFKFMSDLGLSVAQEVVFLVDAKIVKHKYHQLFDTIIPDTLQAESESEFSD